MSPYLQPASPGQVRAALVAHLAKKLGWSGKTGAHILGPLSNADIALCLTVDPAETRRAIFTALSGVLANTVKIEEAA